MLGTLPSEIIIYILDSLNFNQSELVKLSTLSRTFGDAAQHLLFASIKINHLDSFDLLLKTLDRRIEVTGNSNHLDDEWDGGGYMSVAEQSRANSVRKVEIKCKDYGVSGWGRRVGVLLRLCRRVQHLTLIGVEDLRIKYLSGVGELRYFVLQTTTFRANSLPSSQHLYQTLSNVTTLRLANLGIPSPNTHVYFLLSNSPSLKHLEISDFRDLSPELFQSALTTLSITSPILESLKFGNLTSSQQEILPQVLPRFTSVKLFDFVAPFNWIEECDFQVLASSVETVKLSSVKKEYGELDQWTPVLIALGKGFARRAKVIEVSNAYGWLRAEPLVKLRNAVEEAGLSFSARLA